MKRNDKIHSIKQRIEQKDPCTATENERKQSLTKTDRNHKIPLLEQIIERKDVICSLIQRIYRKD